MEGEDTAAVAVPGRATPGTTRFWLDHVHLGLAVSATVMALIVVYLLMTPDRPYRPVMWAVLGLAVTLTVVMALLPWRRLLAAGVALRIMITWSILLVPLVTLLASLDGGVNSPFGLLLILPLVYAAMAYPFRATVLVGTAMVAGHLVIVVSGGDTHPGDLMLQATILVMIAVMGARISRNHWRNVERMEDLADQLRRMAHRDGLTGCLNHRGFRDRLDVELDRSLRADEPIALLHADLDHFKRVNDTLGHPVGDEVLARVGETLRGLARRSDVVARVGGEEFAMLLPGTDLQAAREVGERVRASIASLPGPVGISMSVGVSSLPEVARNREELVATADRALYAAKRAGRDRVVLASRGAVDDARPPVTDDLTEAVS